MSEKHIIKDIRIVPVETYFGAPGIGRIVGRNSKGENYGYNQREWLVQVTTDSGLIGVTNARPAMNRDKLTALYATLQLLLKPRRVRLLSREWGPRYRCEPSLGGITARERVH